ncbi:MAG TPA: ribosome small subunit-dependent GTPase A, partial [Bacillota bacterium]|nr:ribosome small subunit-dependent GTPase A [Bacillota bacterium]
ILVFAFKNPDPNELLISKFLVLAEQSGIPAILVFNKADLISENEAKQNAEKYRKYGYQVICTSVVTQQGRIELVEALKGKISVFSGPSGVGKSALLNMVAPGFGLQTGSVSEKIGRGKHTTREVQLLKLNQGSYVADTPGFTQIAFEDIAPEQLSGFFPDFLEFETFCRFHGCLHQAEPECGVKQGVSSGAISQERYDAYLNLLTEVNRNWKNRYR